VDDKQFKQVMGELEEQTRLLRGIGTVLAQQQEQSDALVEQLFNEKPKDPFKSFRNQRMVRLAESRNLEEEINKG
jgi:hypothetical protein